MERLNYGQVIDSLYNLPKGRDLRRGPKKVNKILSYFDFSPSYKVIHLAGTNGKGSTCTMVHSLLKAHGYKVGLYTGPHLIDINERIRIDDDISNEEFVDLFHRIKKVVDDNSLLLTFFDFVTVMGFLYFEEKGVDFAVMETGMGGEFDSTNIGISTVAVLTGVSLDHQQWLGGTIEEITKTKLGIVHKDSVFVSGLDDDHEVSCKDQYRFGKDFLFEGNDYKGVFNSIKGVELNQKGQFQYKNFALALCSLEVLQSLGLIEIDEEKVREAAASVKVKGRMENYKGMENVFLDIAHNVESMSALSDYLRENFSDFEKKVLVFGCSGDRDPSVLLSIIEDFFDEIVLYDGFYRSVSVVEIQEKYSFSKPVSVCESLDFFKNQLDDSTFYLITGSLYLVGEFLGN